MMESSRSLVLGVLVIALSCLTALPSSAQTDCPLSLAASSGATRTFGNCSNLQNQGSTLSWSFISGATTSANAGGNLSVAFRTTLLGAGGWAAWGINNVGTMMIGTNALIAFNAGNGTNVLPYMLSAALKNGNPPPLACSPIDIEVLSSSAEIDATSLQTTIYATIKLPPGRTVLNQVWNRGPAVTNFNPVVHPFTSDALTSYGSLDVSSGAVTVTTEVPDQTLRNNHGIINAVAWGVMFPIGVMAARYMRPFAIFQPLWFYIHVICQVSAYILGSAGWGTGLKLGADVNSDHRNLAIVMFVLATLQILALVLRPKPDHYLRKYWNVYHHTVGFALVIVSVVNIFEGIDLLQPEQGYKSAYIGIVIALGSVSVLLEIVTWCAWFRKRARTPPQRLENGGIKEVNGRHQEEMKEYNGVSNGYSH